MSEFNHNSKPWSMDNIYKSSLNTLPVEWFSSTPINSEPKSTILQMNSNGFGSSVGQSMAQNRGVGAISPLQFGMQQGQQQGGWRSDGFGGMTDGRVSMGMSAYTERYGTPQSNSITQQPVSQQCR